MPTVILRNASDQGHRVGNDIAIRLHWLQAFIGKQTTFSPNHRWYSDATWVKKMGEWSPFLAF